MVKEETKLDLFLLALYNASKNSEKNEHFYAFSLIDKYNLPIEKREVRRIVQALENKGLLHPFYIVDNANVKLLSGGYIYCEKDSFTSPNTPTKDLYIYIVEENKNRFEAYTHEIRLYFQAIKNLIAEEQNKNDQNILELADFLDEMNSGRAEKNKLNMFLEKFREYGSYFSILKNISDAIT